MYRSQRRSSIGNPRVFVDDVDAHAAQGPGVVRLAADVVQRGAVEWTRRPRHASVTWP
jgi:hypothetical protein